MFSRIFQRSEPQARPIFPLGTLKLSEKVRWLTDKGLVEPLSFVQRHLRGDWGDVGQKAGSDWLDFTQAFYDGSDPVYSRYFITPRLALIVITSSDRSTTTVLLVEELSDEQKKGMPWL